jgi:hypothetical protein
MESENSPQELPAEGQPEAGAQLRQAAEVPRERTEFRALVLANPNYFGNVKASPFEPVLNIQVNTTFEEIGCVGFQPQFNRLEAVVYVHQPFGYGGDVCSNGTPEYVRFYLSRDNGATWSDEGLTSFTAYDIPEGTTGNQRLEYAVTLQIDPAKTFCFIDNLCLVRAILSWNVPPPPNDPDFAPVWGDIHDTHIQVEPFRFIFPGELFEAAQVKLPAEFEAAIDLAQPLAAAQPKVLKVAELQALYRDKKVEPHRFALAEVQQLISQPMMSEQLMAANFKGVLSELDLDLGEIVGKLFPTDGNTTYEALECVGLNPNLDTLVGVIRVKLPSGYSGGPCTAGSTEYVTFWADFNNNGTFETCLGTASVKVVDIDNMPKEGLEYAVTLPIDLTHQRQPCGEGAKVVRIRAILSWQVAPPCANPNYIPVWGNREETLVHIAPGPSIPVGEVAPVISILGGIPISKIDDTTGLTTSDAVFAENNLAADALGRPCPFGLRVNVKGPQFFGFKYRVQVRNLTVSGPWTTVANPLKVVDLNGNVNDHTPDSNGLFEYLPFTQNIGNLLALWDTTGNDLWQVRLQIFDMSDNLLPGVAAHRIQLDNLGPEADLQIETGVGDCGKFTAGVALAGRFVARDLYFGSFSLGVKPPINGPGIGVPVPQSGTLQTVVAPGDAWTLDTTGMQPCGYIIELVAADRAILNSVGPGVVHRNSASAGFCIEAPEA